MKNNQSTKRINCTKGKKIKPFKMSFIRQSLVNDYLFSPNNLKLYNRPLVSEKLWGRNCLFACPSASLHIFNAGSISYKWTHFCCTCQYENVPTDYCLHDTRAVFFARVGFYIRIYVG